jgi:hypothetical protein
MKCNPSDWSVTERRRAVDSALNFVYETDLDPSAYERNLLEQFVQGELNIDQVQVMLEQNQSQLDK